MTGMIIIWENDDDVLGLQYRIHIGVINHPPVINPLGAIRYSKQGHAQIHDPFFGDGSHIRQ